MFEGVDSFLCHLLYLWLNAEQSLVYLTSNIKHSNSYIEYITETDVTQKLKGNDEKKEYCLETYCFLNSHFHGHESIPTARENYTRKLILSFN